MISDRVLRGKAQSKGYWYAASRQGGPAHIITNEYLSLCGAYFDTRIYVRATNLCGHCRKKALKEFEFD